MYINILSLGHEEQPFPFSGTVDLSCINHWGEVVFPEPVSVSGTAYRRHGQTIVELEAEYTLHANCARCLQPVIKRETAKLNYVVITDQPKQNDSTDVIEVKDGILDVAAIVGEDLLLAIDPAVVCSKNCKGLCPVCGANLNKSDCGCSSKKSIDPRFAALSKLLENKSDKD